RMTQSEWLLVLLIGLTTGSGAIFLYYFGLGRVKAAVSAICELSFPLSAILFDYLVNGSVLGPTQWLGAAILVAAIAAVTARHTGDGAPGGPPSTSSSPGPRRACPPPGRGSTAGPTTRSATPASPGSAW
ncbi:MAG: DMT family transporter, partial [Thermoanaerobaculia bacterium]|nr:DMT family transporter [Thermoanaerobaculia bacterium]